MATTDLSLALPSFMCVLRMNVRSQACEPIRRQHVAACSDTLFTSALFDVYCSFIDVFAEISLHASCCVSFKDSLIAHALHRVVASCIIDSH